MSSGANRTRAAEIIAALMWGPKTVKELVAVTGLKRNSLYPWLQTFEASGIVHRGDSRPTKGRPEEVWNLSTTPFGHELPEPVRIPARPAAADSQ